MSRIQSLVTIPAVCSWAESPSSYACVILSGLPTGLADATLALRQSALSQSDLNLIFRL